MNAAKVLAVTVLAGSVSIGLALFGERWLQVGDQDAESLRRGPYYGTLDNLPDLRLPTLEGRELSGSSWAGKVVLLNFWATWCPPCLREIPLLDEWQQRYGNQGLQVVGIAIDRAEEIARFLEDNAVSYPILLGNRDSVELSRELGNRTGGLPFTVGFDPLGRRIFSHTGEIDASLLESEVRPLLLGVN
ncbi:TlpA disulfide reductase family protein [Lamprobacter modestohalophilus]|uniref:TlpA family protein disulfide reductase n=1 Tax=Lamprobacter modestohalophilus TaxID=1064514 RepID=UPI002ADECDB2|nr:TlpA disulfide reductase family protein [Lamprobacter modestohalophilus]MEA1048363.1 TlpA disulfide reductase family protein [Lamprobacter modestohalophilus]